MNTITIQVKVKPNSKQTSFTKCDNTILAKVNAPPQDGAANKELLRAISKKLKITLRQIEIHVGQTSKIKLIRITADLTKDQIFQKLCEVTTYQE